MPQPPLSCLQLYAPVGSPAQSGRILLIAHISQRLALYMFGYWRRPRLGTRQARSARSKHLEKVGRGGGRGSRELTSFVCCLKGAAKNLIEFLVATNKAH